jgi:hypothetical protein
MQERRTRRSEAQTTALEYLLDATRARRGLEALVLVDEHGAVVASSAHAGLDPDRIAADAVAPLGGARMRLTLAPFRLGARMLMLASVGKGLADVSRVAEGTRRIRGE